MKKAFKDYVYNGYNIIPSGYNDWELFPKGISNDSCEAFNNNELIRFDTMQECKTWTRTNEAKLLRLYYLLYEVKNLNINLVHYTIDSIVTDDNSIIIYYDNYSKSYTIKADNTLYIDVENDSVTIIDKIITVE